jgi:hypothetical protein
MAILLKILYCESIHLTTSPSKVVCVSANAPTSSPQPTEGETRLRATTTATAAAVDVATRIHLLPIVMSGYLSGRACNKMSMPNTSDLRDFRSRSHSRKKVNFLYSQNSFSQLFGLLLSTVFFDNMVYDCYIVTKSVIKRSVLKM